MEFIILYNANSPRHKWLIRKNNIKEKRIYGLIEFKDGFNVIKEMVLHHKDILLDLLQLKANEDENRYYVLKVPSDAYRNLTVNEYTALGNLFRKLNLKYNKKTDTFTKI